jgi:hypothetical protein
VHSKGTAGQSGTGANASGWAKSHGDKLHIVVREQQRTHWWFQA